MANWIYSSVGSCEPQHSTANQPTNQSASQAGRTCSLFTGCRLCVLKVQQTEISHALREPTTSSFPFVYSHARCASFCLVSNRLRVSTCCHCQQQPVRRVAWMNISMVRKLKNIFVNFCLLLRVANYSKMSKKIVFSVQIFLERSVILFFRIAWKKY